MSAQDSLSLDQRLAQLRQECELSNWVDVESRVLLALVKCAEIVQTDYLLLSADQQMNAAEALKELGL